jgi:hypothetical protein
VSDQTTPSVDVAGLLESVLATLFGVAADLAPPVLVHPVLGRVETQLQGLWPAPAQPAAAAAGGPPSPVPARLLGPRGLRGFLIGAGASSQAMGKFSLLGLAVDPLQDGWSPDGGAIGDVSVQVIDDASAEPGGALSADATRLSLTTSAVEAVWGLDPLTIDDDTGAALAEVYADLMAAALVARAGTADLQAAAAGRSQAEVLAEARAYLAAIAGDWLAMLLGLVRLRAAQQADAGATDYDAALQAIVTTYDEARAALAQATTAVTAYVGSQFLGGHRSTAPLPDAGTSVDGGHPTDAVRSAVRHTADGGVVAEDGGPDHAADAGADPGDLGNAILAAAIALAGQVRTYSTDPVKRWADDTADCSSFVQRALFGAGLTAFDPGPTHLNTWNTLAFASQDDVFVTVRPADARPGDVLVQGGYATAGDGGVVWKGHCGIFRRRSAAHPELLEGVSMDLHGPTLKGLWGADPPSGYYHFGANLLVRRLRTGRPVVPAVPAAPLSTLRQANQWAHLELVRAIRAALDVSFGLLDASLPSTPAYQAYVRIRSNVMADVQSALDDADRLLREDAVGNADAITAKLEQAQLWLFFVPPYAHLAALIRSAQYDGLISAVQVQCASEADDYARAFSIVGRGTPADLAFARTNALSQARHTRQLLTDLQSAIRSGQEATRNAERIEHVLDVPIEFEAGRVLPPWALASIVAVDSAGFYLSQRTSFDGIAANAPTFVGELGWLEVSAPTTRRLVLHPMYAAIKREAVHGISAADIAFIVGRTIYLLAKPGSPVSWADVVGAAEQATMVVLALHTPKLAVLGLARLADRTRVAMLAAIGGSTDPLGVIAELRRQIAPDLTEEDALDLLLELTSDEVAGHVKSLTAAATTMAPYVAAIVAATKRTGVATSETILAGLAENYPLLPPPP